MSMYRSKFSLFHNIALLLLCLVPAVSWSQLNGSGYSRFGIGDLQYSLNGRAEAMGGAGIASLGASSIDQVNPANWTRISLTRFSLSGIFRSNSTSDAASSAHYANFGFNGVMFAMPVVPSHGVVIGLGLTPYSSVGYTINHDTTQAGYSYNEEFHGEGGVSRAQVGVSSNIGAAINIGIAYNYYFGSIQHNISQSFASGNYSNSASVRQIQIRGSGLTAGIIYAGLGKFIPIPDRAELHIGGFVSSAAYPSADEERRTTSTFGTVSTYDTSLTMASYSLKLPLRFGIGIAYTTDRFSVASDFVSQNWNEPFYPGALTATVRNSYRWSLGTEITPKREQMSPLLQRLAYRLGVYYDATYYVVHNQPINETGITGGLAIPVLGDTRIDVAAEYGMRGTTDFNLQKDSFFRLSFTLIGSETWFVRPTEE